MNTMSLEERVQRLEDIEAIKDLTARYSFAINKGWNGKSVHVDAMPSIFAEDARWESKEMNVTAEGLPQIMKALSDLTTQTYFSMHSFTNPIIEIRESEASGNWLLWIASIRNGGRPNEVFMSEDIEYVRTEKGWRIRRVDVYFGMMLNDRLLQD